MTALRSVVMASVLKGTVVVPGVFRRPSISSPLPEPETICSSRPSKTPWTISEVNQDCSSEVVVPEPDRRRLAQVGDDPAAVGVRGDGERRGGLDLAVRDRRRLLSRTVCCKYSNAFPASATSVGEQVDQPCGLATGMISVSTNAGMSMDPETTARVSPSRPMERVSFSATCRDQPRA